MKLFEVIFWGSHGDGNAEDTIYLVRALDFRAAVEDVERNASPNNHNGKRFPLAHVVYEIGTDLSPYADPDPGILRGPYSQSRIIAAGEPGIARSKAPIIPRSGWRRFPVPNQPLHRMADQRPQRIIR